MVLPPPMLKTKKQKKREKEKAERGPVLGNFDQRPTMETTVRPPIRGKRSVKKLSQNEKRILRKRKHQERRLMRKTLQAKLQRPVFVMPQLDNEVDEEEMAARKTPPVHFRVNTRAKKLNVTVVLHHCPPQFIHLDPTRTHFVLNTLQWTKKYEVSVPYVDGIECDPAGAEAHFEHDILRVSLPIVVFPDAARERQARISAGIREGRLLRFVQARGGELVGMRKVEPKERKRKRDGEYESTPIVRTGPRKKFVTDKSVLAQLAEEAAAAEESKVAGRQAQMGATEAFFKEKRAAKLEGKRQKADLLERTVDSIVAQEQQRIKEKAVRLGLDPLTAKPPLAAGEDARSTPKATTGKKVTFAVSKMVVKFGDEGSCTGKKAKRKHGKETTVIEYKD